MVIELRTEGKVLGSANENWLKVFMKVMQKLGHDEIIINPVADPSFLPLATQIYLKLEAFFGGTSKWQTVQSVLDHKKIDLIIDLTSTPVKNPNIKTLAPAFNGCLGQRGLIFALLENGNPEVSIFDVNTNEVLSAGKASLEAANATPGAMAAIYSRIPVLIEKALKSRSSKSLHSIKPVQAPSPKKLTKSAIKLAIKSIVRAVYERLCRVPYWHVGYRFADEAITKTMSLDGPVWRVLECPGNRFYADPVPVNWQGQYYLFFEDFEYTSKKGVISVVSFDENGNPKNPPQIALEEEWHLSYPFLFESKGEIFMIPEGSASGRIDIYKADNFPLGWKRHATLIENIEAADVTIYRQKDKLWLFAVTRNCEGGYSDTLSIFHADDLFGPWVPHTQNPVLIDPAKARPAGNMFEHDGKLFRPVQDCSTVYGGQIHIMEVTALDAGMFQQSVFTTLKAGKKWPGRKLHTLNCSGKLETIDGTIVRPRLLVLAKILGKIFKPK